MQVSFFENLQILLCLKIAARLSSGFNIDTKGLGILAMVERESGMNVSGQDFIERAIRTMS